MAFPVVPVLLGTGVAVGAIVYVKRKKRLASGTPGGTAGVPAASQLPPPGGTGPARNTKPYVRWVQSSLNLLEGARLSVDGLSGPSTQQAISAFQRKNGLSVDGKVGQQTEAALVAALRARGAPNATPPIG